MYISDQMQKAIQEDIVSTTLRQAELRWMVMESETQTAGEPEDQPPRSGLAHLVRLMAGVMIRP